MQSTIKSHKVSPGFIARLAENCIILTEGKPHAIVTITMSVITLLTDFGLKDGYVGVMKGVILGIAPQAQIADITHNIHPQNVMEGALAFGRVASFFPKGTIHVGVVDPGVGTRRRPIAACLGDQYFVGPDNGLCTVILEQTRENGAEIQFVHLDRTEFWLTDVSHVFHGRDIFAPVAAHLANGVALNDMGTLIQDPILLEIPKPKRIQKGWRGEVIIVDNFGNLSTNITRANLTEKGEFRVVIAGNNLHGLIKTFGEAEPGELVALIGEAGDLSISVVNGNAAERLGVGVGEPVEFHRE
jgi:S-adenosylmethionine hydrolase